MRSIPRRLFPWTILRAASAVTALRAASAVTAAGVILAILAATPSQARACGGWEREVVLGFTAANEPVTLKAGTPGSPFVHLVLEGPEGVIAEFQTPEDDQGRLIEVEPDAPLPRLAEVFELLGGQELPRSARIRLRRALMLRRPNTKRGPRGSCWSIQSQRVGEAIDVWFQHRDGRRVTIVERHRPHGMAAAACAEPTPRLYWSPDRSRVVVRVLTDPKCGDSDSNVQDLFTADVPPCEPPPHEGGQS